MRMARSAIRINLRPLPRFDLVVHFGTMDIERNISRYFDALESPLDIAAAGWRLKIQPMMTSETKLLAVFDRCAHGWEPEPCRTGSGVASVESGRSKLKAVIRVCGVGV